jgi:hypothetical protein
LAKELPQNQHIDKVRIISALKAAVASEEAHEVHDAMELIKALQESDEVDEKEVVQIEWIYLPLLDGYHGALPKHLEKGLASDPNFFCEMIRLTYRSKKDPPDNKPEPTPQQKALAQNAWKLLNKWRTVPGSGLKAEFSGKAFKLWIDEVVKSTTETGHLVVALHHVGAVLIGSPPDPSGLWMHRAVAEVLDSKSYAEMRLGYRTARVNARGVHMVDPTGKPEKALAEKYNREADDIENAGFHRIAATLRDVAERYVREAERIIADHQAESKEDEER